MSKISAVPPGFHSVTPHLVVRNAAAALDFYRRAFGAEIVNKLGGPGGPIMHAEVRIGDSIVMLNDEMEGQSAPQATFKNATDTGAQAVMPLENMPWGDRYGIVVDPFGHTWAIATRVENVTEEELYRRLSAAAQ
jgi:PhnB protein